MAFDATEIQRLKAAIPIDYRPRPQAAGQLTNDFLAVDLLRKSTALEGTERDRHNLGMAYLNSPDADAAGPTFLLTGAQAVARNAQVIQSERAEHDITDFAFDQMRENLRRHIERLNAMLVDIDAAMKKIHTRRDEIGQELEALDELTRLKRSGKFDLNNPAHAQLARSAGLSPEELDRMSVHDLRMRRRDLDREDGQLEDQWNKWLKLRKGIVKERDAAVEIEAELAAADTAEVRILAERRASSLLGVQQIAEVAYIAEDRSVKIRAADAVASNEQAAVRTESQTYNRDAVLRNEGAILNKDSDDFELADAVSSTKSANVPKPS
ncbi:hypothetical protein WG908_04415 [Sphingobium sp. AN641]|uniref:hypothetical protein n=1 Tax=Sphingobium sp. AN641 TaxID=3133443 RepID=UPI0030C38656